LCTPTGAALLTTFAAGFGPTPAMRLEQVGVGAGTREGKTRPNIMRLLVGEVGDEAAEETDTIEVLETQLDDVTGQVLSHLMAHLLQAGALDAYVTPVLMKKGRPGQLLSVLCSPADSDRLTRLIFEETPTFGVRRYAAVRAKLARRTVQVETRYGPIRVKVGSAGGRTIRATAEHDDCAAAARAKGVSLREVQVEAERRWAETHAGTVQPGD
jgi:uncharacterized protein (DUF111 family)